MGCDVHVEAFEFVTRAARVVPSPQRVLEVGARNVNGSARDAWPADTPWLGVDLLAGDGVDVVADFATAHIDGPFDLVVCCEVFEHARNVAALVDRMIDVLRPDGYLLMTCATDGRVPHGADGGGVRAGEWYRNVAPWELVREDLDPIISEVHGSRGDLYVLGQKVA